MLKAGGRDDGLGKHRSVSSLPIPPPRWCSMPWEASYTTPKQTAHASISHFPLATARSARCCCSAPGSFTWDAGSVTESMITRRSATLFGLTGHRAVTIDLMRCSVCKHARRHIGPDLGELGVFNWNNSMLFTHELLNAYTNAYTASETPFSAFCLTVQRTYIENSHDHKFCSDETFVRVWFAFVQLQELDSRMECPTCGPSPDIVVVDGISLGTHSSKLVATVQPPTVTDQSSETINTISSDKARRLPAIPEAPVRQLVACVLDEISGKSVQPVSAEEVLALRNSYPELAGFLCYISAAGGRSSRYYAAYHELASQIIAPDIVLQLVPHDAIELLGSIALFPNHPVPPWLQSLCPAFGAVVNAHRSDGTPLPQELRNIAGWLASRALDVYNRLAVHEPAPVDIMIPQGDWKKTGTCYGHPAIRRRRIYAKLRHDTQRLDRDAEQMGDCNKFYKTYSKNSLTGGIFVLWCRHSICLGFHSIPVAEGRNDVFSAVYTRFPVAPKIIVYDFACQLAPYCLVREAKYFRHTRFLIDELHAHDHTRCGRACFASNTMRFDDQVRAANTSAAECGNKGMKRIRKSVSFMTYEHAVIFTKVFLDIWNRSITRRMAQQ